MDEFIGKQMFEGMKEENNILEFKLYGRRTDSQIRGSVFVQYKTFPMNEYNML